MCLRQQKMNGYDAIFNLIFWKKNSIAFKRLVMDSETINGEVDAGETVIAKILNKNQCGYHGKVLKLAK